MNKLTPAIHRLGFAMFFGVSSFSGFALAFFCHLLLSALGVDGWLPGLTTEFWVGRIIAWGLGVMSVFVLGKVWPRVNGAHVQALGHLATGILDVKSLMALSQTWFACCFLLTYAGLAAINALIQMLFLLR